MTDLLFNCPVKEEPVREKGSFGEVKTTGCKRVEDMIYLKGQVEFRHKNCLIGTFERVIYDHPSGRDPAHFFYGP